MDKTITETQDMSRIVSIGEASSEVLSAAPEASSLSERAVSSSRPQNKNLKPFKKGQSGNPAGRPKGARNKLANAFAADLLDDWNDRGMEAIQQCREQRPQDYLKVIASIMPKDFNVNMRPLEELSDEQLRENIKRTLDELGQAGAVILGGIAQGTTNKATKSKA